jgi:hypothetical protein
LEGHEITGVFMQLKSLIAAIALSASIPAMAGACQDLGTLGVSHPVAAFGNSFAQAQAISDCYVFALGNAANAVGVMVDWDWSSQLDINLTSATLTGADYNASVQDLSDHHFSFSNLTTGDYQLVIAGDVTDHAGLGFENQRVGYLGALAVSPVPEPESLAMFALGLAVVTWGSRRKA